MFTKFHSLKSDINASTNHPTTPRDSLRALRDPIDRRQRPKMRRTRQQRILAAPPDGTIHRFLPIRIDAIDRHLHRLHRVTVSVQRQLNDRVQGHVEVRHLVGGRVQEVTEHAAQYSLMGNCEDVRFAFKLC